VKSTELLNSLLVELFNHVLYLEEQNLQIKGINLTMNEIHTIEAINDVKEATMTNVSRKLLITLGTLTTAVKKLEAKGYVFRVRNSNDARIVKLGLSDTAREVLKIQDDYQKNMFETVLNDLSDEEEEVFLSSLTKIEQYFKRNHTYK
jgi:DNA-binding MarR family transcriptional regulator